MTSTKQQEVKRDEKGRFTEQGHPGFPKGKSPNPGGRPQSRIITNALMKELSREVDGKTQAEHVALALVRKARQGDVAAIKEVMDRAEGKLTHKVEADVTTTHRQEDAFSDWLRDHPELTEPIVDTYSGNGGSR